MRSAKLQSFCLVLVSVALLSGCDLFVSPEKRVERARADISKNDYGAAVIELKNALESDPDQVDARLLLAQASLHLGDALGAQKELRRARDAGAQPAQVAELSAEVFLALGQARELLAQIGSNQVALREPTRSMYRAEALLALGQADDAAASFQDVLDAAPDSVRALVGLARARAGQRQAVEALRLLEQAPAGSADDVSVLLAKGEILAAQGRLTDARSVLQKAFGARAGLPVLQQARLLATLTEAELTGGDVEGARRALEALAQITPESTLTALLNARIAMASQDYATAAAQLQRIVVGLPDFVPARFLLGAALVAQGSFNQAESHLSRVVALAPDNLEARKLLARVRLRIGQPDAALELLSSLQSEGDADVNALMGLAHMQLGESARALTFLERTAAMEPSNRDRQLELAASYLRAGEYRKSVSLLRGLEHVDGDSRRDTLLISAVAALDGIDAGDAEMNALLAAHPKDIALLNTGSLILAQRGEFERARGLLGRALAENPAEADTLINSARVELAAGNLPAASVRLQGVIAVAPDNLQARMGLAEIAMRANDLRAAAAALEPLNKDGAAALEPRLALARIYLLDRRAQNAADLLAKVEQGAGRNAAVNNAIGLLYLEAGRYDEAGAQFQKAISLEGGNADYWLNQARVQLALERRVQARESLERARAARPDSATVIAALAMLDIRDGRPAAGAQRIAALRKARPDDPSLLALEGDFLAATRDYEGASRAFDAAIRLRPSRTLSIRAYHARRDGRLRDATAPLEAWVAKQPDDFLVQAVLAEAYVRGGQLRRARETYEFIVEHAAPNALVLNNLAWLYQETKDARAEATAEKAYRLQPGNAAIADTYGWILVESGKVADGLKILQPIQAEGGPEIRYHYAVALARSSDVAQARRVLEDVVASKEEFGAQGDARRLLKELSTR